MPMIDQDAFKQAMCSFPTGVVIAAALDSDGEPWGFTASSFSSVSLDPPLVLVCLAKIADCHCAFTSARMFSINILRSSDEALARRFATRGVSKFEGDEFTACEDGPPVMGNAVAALVCRRYADHDCGDHTIIVGEVKSIVQASPEDALVYYRRDYWQLSRTAGVQAEAPQPAASGAARE